MKDTNRIGQDKISHSFKIIYKIYCIHVSLHWVEVQTHDHVLRNTSEWLCRVGRSDIVGYCFFSAIGDCNIIRFFL